MVTPTGRAIRKGRPPKFMYAGLRSMGVSTGTLIPARMEKNSAFMSRIAAFPLPSNICLLYNDLKDNPEAAIGTFSDTRISMTLAILQARVSSSRLPGKVLKPILGRPMLELQLERVMRAARIDRLVVATSVEASDDPIVESCRKTGVAVFRGNLTDVLDRYYHAAAPYRPDTIVRLTGDCPLADPAVIDYAIEYFLTHDLDYVGNCVERTYPIGLDVEVFRFVCLEKSWREARLPSEREHVTPFIKNHPEWFSLGHIKSPVDLSHHRWTVDEPQDFAFVTAVYEALYPHNPRFTTDDILAYLSVHPEIMMLNYHIVHGAGYEKSLREDMKYRHGTKPQLSS